MIELSQGILRFEANIRGTDLSNFSYHRFAGELLNIKTEKHLILKHLEKLNLDKHLSYNTMYEISKLLSEAYPPNKVQELLGFIVYNQIYGSNSISKLSKSTYNRRMKCLRDLGITPVFAEKELPPLDISHLLI